MPVDPNTKARLFNSVGEAADTPVLATNVTPSESPVELKITTSANESTAVDLVEWDGTTEFNYTLNDGSAVGASDLLVESVPVNGTSGYNVQYRQAVTVELLQIDEQSLADEN